MSVKMRNSHKKGGRVNVIRMENNSIKKIRQNIRHGKTKDTYNERNQGSIKKINNCREPVESFTGRTEQLSELDVILNKQNMVVICGAGGVGKTQLARKYVADNIHNYNCLYWLQAESPDILVKMLHQLAAELNVPVKKDGMNRDIIQIRNEIYTQLQNRETLLIFDNTLNEANIKDYIPSATELKNSKLHVILTSQCNNWTLNTVTCYPLTPLDDANALQLFDKILNSNESDFSTLAEKVELIKILENMPLSIQIAAAYIKMQMKQNQQYSVRRYINKLNNETDNIHIAKNADGYDKTLHMSVKVTLDKISEEKLLAMELIYIMAYLNPDVIDKEILLDILKINDTNNDEFHEAIQINVNYSILSCSDDNLYFHRTVQKIIRDEQSQAGNSEKYFKLAIDYVLNTELEDSLKNAHVLKFAKKHLESTTNYCLHHYSSRLLKLITLHGCSENLSMIFNFMDRYIVNLLIHNEDLLFWSVCSKNIEIVEMICQYDIVLTNTDILFSVTPLHVACNIGCSNIVKFLIEKGASLNIKCKTGRTVLHYACISGHYDIVSYLLETSTDQVNERDNENKTPLQYSLQIHTNDATKNVEMQKIARLLIEKGANPNMKSDENNTVLHLAAINADYKFIDHLFKTNTLDLESHNLKSPLIFSIAASKSIPEEDVMSTLVVLLENGAQIDATGDNGNSLLHYAAFHNRTKIILFLIQEQHLSINTKNYSGATPLLCALLSYQSNNDIMTTVKLLIDLGADVNVTDSDDKTILHYAATKIHHDVLSYIIKTHRICVNTKDYLGRSLLLSALLADKCKSEDEVMTIIKLLLANGAQVNDIDKNGRGILHYSAICGRHEILSFIIQEYQLSVNIVDNLGNSPLLSAGDADESVSEDQILKTVKLLLANGAEIDVTNNKGNNFLHMVAKCGHYQILSYLIKNYKLPINTKNAIGRSPLLSAISTDRDVSKNDMMKIIRTLITNGSQVNETDDEDNGILHFAAEGGYNQVLSYLLDTYELPINAKNSDGMSPLLSAVSVDNSIPEYKVMKTIKLLINNGANVEDTDKEKCGVLHYAAEGGFHQILSYLIDTYELSVNAKDTHGMSPLLSALSTDNSIAEYKVLTTVQLLIDKRAIVEETDNEEGGALHFAAEGGFYWVLSYLLETFTLPVNVKDSDGMSPLLSALNTDNSIAEDQIMKTIKLLINKGANVEETNNRNSGVLHFAALNGFAAVLSYLIDTYELPVNAKDSHGMSPLLSALCADNSIPEYKVMQTIKLLIDKGARVDETDNEDGGVLHYAALRGFDEVLSYLLDTYKLPVNAKNSDGNSPLLYAVRADNSIPQYKVINTIKLLIDKGARVDETNNNDSGVLHFAALNGFDEVLSYLLDTYELPVNAKDSDGNSPLLSALCADKSIPEDNIMKTIKILIDNGSIVETTCKNGCTVLHLAAQFGHYEALVYLLDNYNISINTKDLDEETPLHCAVIADESIKQETVHKIVTKLLSMGADINIKNNEGKTAFDLATPQVKKLIRARKPLRTGTSQNFNRNIRKRKYIFNGNIRSHRKKFKK